MTLWSSMGFYAVLLYAGLLDIPDEIIESARLDGANGLKLVRHIVVPLSLPILLSSIIFSLNATLKVFDSLLALNSGGPGTSTAPLTLYMYRTAFEYAEYGYGSTIAARAHAALPRVHARDLPDRPDRRRRTEMAIATAAAAPTATPSRRLPTAAPQPLETGRAASRIAPPHPGVDPRRDPARRRALPAGVDGPRLVQDAVGVPLQPRPVAPRDLELRQLRHRAHERQRRAELPQQHPRHDPLGAPHRDARRRRRLRARGHDLEGPARRPCSASSRASWCPGR